MSPADSDAEAQIVLKNGDVVKIELGVHIDGFPVSVGHTIVVGATAANPVVGAKADVIKGAYVASEVAARLLRPGNKNYKVTDVVQKVAVDQFGVKPIEGLVSSEVKPVYGEGDKQIIFNPTPVQRANTPECEFEAGEIYNVDILFSSGPAKIKESPVRTCVYKRVEDTSYALKLQTSRKLLNEVQNNFGYMPFSLRNVSDVSKARAGMVECVKNRLMLPYGVLEEEKEAIVAQFLFTVLLMPNGTVQKVSGLPLDESIIKSEKIVSDEEILEILKSPIKETKKQ